MRRRTGLGRLESDSILRGSARSRDDRSTRSPPRSPTTSRRRRCRCGPSSRRRFVAYSVFIFVPAWNSYGRLWEKVAAGFLSLFILATLVGIGVGIGVGGLYLWIQGA